MLRVLGFTILLSVLYPCVCTITYNLTVHGESQGGYFITVLFGTPPQEINLLLDTGSSNIAVACVPTLAEHSKYFHFNESTSFHHFDIAVDLHYVVGRWNGFLAKEFIHFSNKKLPCTLACMVTIDKIFDESSQFQGLLGLAYPYIAIPDPSVLPFMTVLTAAENISDVFSLDLCGPYYTSKEQWTQCGKFQIGGISDVYKPDVVYTPLYKEWFYEVIITDFKVGTNKAPFHCLEFNNGKSTIDSGTTDLYLPHAVYDWAIHQIRSVSRFPDKVWIDDLTACIPDSEFHIEVFPSITLSFYHTQSSVFNIIVSPDLYLLPVITYMPNTLCFKLAFVSSDEGINIGSTILKGFYVVFDRENKRIGFANSSYLNDQNYLPGLVMQPNYTNTNIEWCFKKQNPPSSSVISSPMIILLFFSVFVAVILLYMLVSWIFRHFSIPHSESVETNNLVYDDEYL